MWKEFLKLLDNNDLYNKALTEAHEMLDLDLQMFEASVETLRRTDSSDLKVDIYALDRRINSFERDVRRKIMTHLMVSGTSDLTAGVILIGVVSDIERIGDYTKNIHDLARTHPTRLLAGELEEELVAAEQNVQTLFFEAITAFKASDEDSARRVVANFHPSVIHNCDTITQRIVGGKIKDLSVGTAAAVALYARYLRRIGSHSHNIVTSVVNPFDRIGYVPKELN